MLPCLCVNVLCQPLQNIICGVSGCVRGALTHFQFVYIRHLILGHQSHELIILRQWQIFRHNPVDCFHGLCYPIFFLGQHDFRNLFLIRPMHWCFECISVIQCCYVLSQSRFSKVAAPPGKAIFGYLVFHAHSAPHYFLFFVISEPKKQFKPHINNGSRSLLFYFRFFGSRWRVAFTQGLSQLRWWGRNGFRLQMIGIFTDTYTSAFISSRIFLKSFESCQKSLSLLNFRLFLGWHRSHCRQTCAADDR